VVAEMFYYGYYCPFCLDDDNSLVVAVVVHLVASYMGRKILVVYMDRILVAYALDP
jgi:hypothetical protein